MSWAFFGVFTGFGATQSLESSLNATLGFVDLACLYAALVVVGLVCSPIVSAGVARVGWRVILVAGATTYLLMIVSNLVVGRSGWVVQPLANVLLGTGAAFLWTTQNFYFGQCASRVARATSDDGTSVTDAVESWTMRFNSSFFSVFQFSNMTGNLISSCLMLAFSGIPWLRMLLFAVLAALTVVGIHCFWLLPAIDYQTSEREAPSAGAALRTMALPSFAPLLPWIVTNGMTIAVVNSDYTSDVVTPLLGTGYVGIFMTVFFGGDALSTLMWGRLVSSHTLTRRAAFLLSGLFWAAFFAVKMLWVRAPNFEQRGGTEWVRIPDSQVGVLDVALPLLLAALAAAGDGFWTPGPPAVLQGLFGDSDLLASMAAYKAAQSLGFVVAFVLGAALGPYPFARDAIVLACCAASVVSALHVLRLAPAAPASRALVAEPNGGAADL